jgi:hypothetical protein
MNHQVNKLRRMQAWLAGGMKKGQPLYGWWLTLSVFIWGMASLSLGEALWPWLSGESAFSLVRAMGGVVTFSTSMMMWSYVKVVNQAAARVLEAAIQRVEEPAGRVLDADGRAESPGKWRLLASNVAGSRIFPS